VDPLQYWFGYSSAAVIVLSAGAAI